MVSVVNLTERIYDDAPHQFEVLSLHAKKDCH